MAKLPPLQKEAYQKDKVPPLVDSQKEQLDIGKIVVIATYHTDSPAPPNQVAMSIMMELQQPGTIPQIIGNTLFIAHPSKQQGKYIFRALNADTPRNYFENSKLFIRSMQKQEATELATQFNDKRLLRFIKTVAEDMARNKNNSTPPIGYREYQKNGEYLVVISLKRV